MSFLKRLFGRQTPAERICAAETLLSEGSPGEARLELESVLAAPGASEEEQGRARTLLVQARDKLAELRLEVAEALQDSGDLDDAREALELALSLTEQAELRSRIEQQMADLKQAALSRAEASHAAALNSSGALLACAVPRPLEAEVGLESEQASPLEMALLTYSEEEANELQQLARVDPALEEALIAMSREGAADLRERWLAVGRGSTAHALVLRERARAALMLGDAQEAVQDLEKVRHELQDDPELFDLLMEARLATGDKEQAAAVAGEALERGLARDFAAAVSVLAQSGRTDQALAAVDAALAATESPSSGLWEMRGSLCARLGRADEGLEADRRALKLFRAQCNTCSGGSAQFPLAGARRLAESLSTKQGTTRESEELADLARLLMTNDLEHQDHWRSLLLRLES